MKKTTMAILVLTVISTAKPALWNRAEKLCRNQNHYPEQIVIKEIVSTKSGIKVEQSEIVLKQSADNHKRDYLFISAMANGNAVKKKSDIKDLTELFAEANDEDICGAEINPLLGEISDIIEVGQYLTQRRSIMKYKYLQKTSWGIWKGTLHIDKKNGYPIKLTAELQNTPVTKDGVTFNALILESRFTPVGNNDVTPLSAVYKSEISVKEGILPTFHGTAENSIRFSSFQQIKK